MRKRDLTRRELQVLNLAKLGLNAPEIGKALGISSQTAKNHMASVRRVLRARNNPHAVYIAIHKGLIR